MLGVQAEANFNKVLDEHGKAIFVAEISVLLLRLEGRNLDDLETRTRAIKLLKPFERFAKLINLHDEELDALWESLHRAETGDATDFKARLTKLLQDVAKKDAEKEAQLAAPTGDGMADQGTPSAHGALQ